MVKSRRRKNLIILFFGVLFCLMFLPGCNSSQKSDDNNRKNANASRKYKVVMIMKATNSAFWESVHSGANAASAEYNMQLLFEGPDNEEDYETQNVMIDEAIADGADAIVFSAVDYTGNSEAIDRAAKAGIKIVVIDSDVKSDLVSCRIGTDNYEAGCTAGKAVLNGNEDKLQIGIVNFDKNSENGQQRERGFRDTVMEDDRTVIADALNVKSSTKNAMEETEKMLTAHPEINVIATFNEWTSLGVGYAVKELGASDQVRVIAFDSNVISVGMLETGEVDALVVQNPYAMGYLGIESAYKLLNGYHLDFQEMDTSTTLVTRLNMYDEECQRALFAFDKVY